MAVPHQVPTIQTVQKTVEFLETPHLDGLIDMTSCVAKPSTNHPDGTRSRRIFQRLSVWIEWHVRHSCRNANCEPSHLLIRLSGSEIQNWFTPGSSRNSHNDHVIHGVSLVTEVIDSCSQAGGVPQAMGDHCPTPCRRPKEEVDVPTFLLQISTLDASRAPKGPLILKTLEGRSTFPC